MKLTGFWAFVEDTALLFLSALNGNVSGVPRNNTEMTSVCWFKCLDKGRIQ